MNEHETDNEYQADEATAHYVALRKMNPDDLERGDLACVDYLDEFDREMGVIRPTPPLSLSTLLDALPTIRSSPEVAQHLVDLYHASGLEVPAGLLDLPLQWAKAFHELIRETHWPAHPHCSIRDVFGWNHVLRFGGHLHIQFESRLPHTESHCSEVGGFIAELHRRFEPGIYTAPGRLIEFM
ncbi:MAG: hypothetical protein GVY36_10055 [Verrucomicrobia bacterium]|jgi:hypothetical protein|nr:hypothetical protein [Verrucomicrobiota bacterium]